MQYTTNRNLLPLERVNPKKSRAFFVSSIAQKKNDAWDFRLSLGPSRHSDRAAVVNFIESCYLSPQGR